MPPSFLSELLGELRTALGYQSGIFPPASTDDQRALLESIAAEGVLVPIVVDERGIIDGYQRVRACEELAGLCALADEHVDWERVAGAAAADRADAIEVYGRETVEACERLADAGPDLIAAAREQRWADPPVDRREGLGDEERRTLAVTLNAHRRHLTRGQVALLVEVEISLNPDRSNREIARTVGCSHTYVNQIRASLAEEERLLTGNPLLAVEVESSFHWRPVASLACPHCRHDLELERAGKAFRLELGAGDAEAA